MRNCKKDAVNLTRRLVVHKALACVTSVVLAVGLMPGIALADDNGYKCVIDHDLNSPLYVPYDPTGTYIYNDVEVKGNVAVNSGDQLYALHANVEATFSDDARAEVTGSVSCASGVGNFYAVGADAAKGGTAEVVVGGDVTATSKNSGADAKAEGVHVQVGNAPDDAGKATVAVNGKTDVSFAGNAGGDTAALSGVAVNNVVGQSSVTVGDVTAGRETTGGYSATGLNMKVGKGEAAIAALGNVAAATNDGKAVGIKVNSEGVDGKTTILVDGTVSARTPGSQSAGIFLENGAGTLDITVWKIDAGSGVVASSETASGGFVEDKDLESKINYIIKVDQPKQGNILSLLGTTKKNVVVGGNTYSYDVANWGNEVNNKVYLQAAQGWDITGAYCYNDEGKTTKVPLARDGGGWYVVVPNGGGVYLTAEVAKQQFDITFQNDKTVLQSDKLYYGDMPEYRGATPAKDPTVEAIYEFAGWKPVIDKVTKSVVYETTFTGKAREYEMSFDLGGGTVDGKSTYTVAAAYGSTITLPTPVREGYEFLYWEGSRYNGGDSYKVEGPHSFKAVWKEKEPAPEPEPGPAEEEPAETKAVAAPASTMPATGDTLPATVIMATLLLSGAMIAVSRRKLEAAHPAKRDKHAR